MKSYRIDCVSLTDVMGTQPGDSLKFKFDPNGVNAIIDAIQMNNFGSVDIQKSALETTLIVEFMVNDLTKAVGELQLGS